MFIRRTQTRNTASGERYCTYRLVRSERVAGKVKQFTLLNLGRHFDVDQAHWPALCCRSEALLAGQATSVYCLRSSETDRDDEKLRRTYILLTDLKAVFRSLKSELGLRPVCHHTEERTDSHLFITVRAYLFAQRADGRTLHVRKATRPEGRRLDIRLDYARRTGTAAPGAVRAVWQSRLQGGRELHQGSEERPGQ